ncbi:MAG: type 1 glutamine amidotransferase [Planctomycetes bacterium]|nr:type 1 glutamine amidotransferase [Planctomycetota bacterium]
MAIVIFQHSSDCPADLLMESLRHHGQRIHVIELNAGGVVPPDLDDVHGVVSLGGPQTVHLNNAPWMAPEKAFLKMAHEAGVPVLGLCLGAQLLAAALGGETRAMSKPEIGWHAVKLNAVGREDALFTGQPWSQPQMCWHSDEVSKLPAGGVVLASSTACPIHAFSVGLRSFGVQYHPEWNRETIMGQINGGAAELQKAGLDGNQMRTQTETNAANQARLGRRFFDAVNIVLMPGDRVHQGVPANHS